MVIQRIQTLWLLIAAGLMTFVGLRPFAWIGDQACFVSDFPVLATLNWLIVALLVIAIFTFKNLRLQKTITLVGLFLMVALCVVGYVYTIQLFPEATPEWAGGVLMIAIAAMFDIMAYRGMKRDQKRLRNSDRLWS